jgi:hypothetical protein
MEPSSRMVRSGMEWRIRSIGDPSFRYGMDRSGMEPASPILLASDGSERDRASNANDPVPIFGSGMERIMLSRPYRNEWDRMERVTRSRRPLLTPELEPVNPPPIDRPIV